jgi:hypothetical protein
MKFLRFTLFRVRLMRKKLISYNFTEQEKGKCTGSEHGHWRQTLTLEL